MNKPVLDKKQKLILGGVIGLLIIGGVLFSLLKGEPNDTKVEEAPKPAIKALATEDLPIIKLTAKNNGQELVLSLETKQNFATLDRAEYELIYYLEDGLSRGAMGEIELNGGEGEKEILLGTCSRDVCRYDEGVTGGKVIITLTQENQLHSFETEFAFVTSDTPYQTQEVKISTAKGTLVVLEGGGLPIMPDQEILAGPYAITAETGSGEVSFELATQNTLLFWNQNSWEKVESLQDLPLGTYLLVTS